MGSCNNLKADNMDISSDDVKNYLELKDEEPKIVANRYIEDMTEKYEDYKKFSILGKKVKI